MTCRRWSRQKFSLSSTSGLTGLGIIIYKSTIHGIDTKKSRIYKEVVAGFLGFGTGG
jgi:hypothetical protein